MVTKYNLVDIPTTRSDKTNRMHEHYQIKKSLIEWIRDKTVVFKFFDHARYDECLISPTIAGSSFYPDVAIFTTSNKQIWIEVETNPLNILYKIVILVFLKQFKPTNFPEILIFGISGLPDSIEKQYLKTFDRISKLTGIRKIMIYMKTCKNGFVRVR